MRILTFIDDDWRNYTWYWSVNFYMKTVHLCDLYGENKRKRTKLHILLLNHPPLFLIFGKTFRKGERKER